MSSNKKLVLDAIKKLTREYGRCAFGIDTIVKETGISKNELWDHDTFGGILGELSDDGYIVLEDRSANPDVALDSEILC